MRAGKKMGNVFKGGKEQRRKEKSLVSTYLVDSRASYTYRTQLS